MDLSFVWFTCGPDEEMLAESVRRVVALAPRARFVIQQDPSLPLSAAGLTVLLRMGRDLSFGIRTSGEPHGRLAGLPHVRQQLAAMADAERGIVIKLDSDTVIRSLDWLEQMGPNNAIGFEDGPDRPWCGPCYGLRRGVAGLLQATLSSLHTPLLQLPPGVPEDAAVWSLMCRAGLAGVVRLPGWPGPWFAGYHYPSGPDAGAIQCYRQSVLHCGNRDSRPDRRRIAALMRAV